ncbi:MULTISPECIES: polysaccharide biosynthesis/export family protein [Sphingobacterium]|uniref:Polysaccharide biosynthesis/export family protein n=1 Tax=Sphingobacterium tenebrionis TaxID=3111775 RepID=A0ABU8I6V3_9SPHI|nr:polysaccharide biosynthesis/export family protein [Sphingobacterium sp. CZ-2]QBR11247.1 sugar transporter [Sphingobacterium sp. CZ-2]
MKKIIFGISVFTLLLLNSCLVSKKVVFVEDMSPNLQYEMEKIPPLKIQANDRLSIQVGSKNPELAAPFNNESGLYTVDEKGAILSNVVGSDRGYLVDQNGNIEFPILGTLNVEGKSIDEIKNLIKSRLEGDKILNDATVKVELTNLKIIMMGEVGGIGILNVPDGQINLLEAITRSGGLTNNAMTNEVAVIREENGTRKMYLNDIEKVALFESPTFHLKQNDIVYVKPRTAVTTPREDMTWRYIGMFTGLTTLVFTMLAVFKK